MKRQYTARRHQSGISRSGRPNKEFLAISYTGYPLRRGDGRNIDQKGFVQRFSLGGSQISLFFSYALNLTVLALRMVLASSVH
jgi:hypothetical protein